MSLQTADLDPTTGSTTSRLGPLGSPVDGLASADFNGDGARDFVFGLDGEVRIYDGATTTLLWQSGFLGFAAGARDSLRVGDPDHDGRQEIVVNNGRGVVIFESSRVWTPIFADGFESGDLSGWTLVVP